MIQVISNIFILIWGWGIFVGYFSVNFRARVFFVKRYMSVRYMSTPILIKKNIFGFTKFSNSCIFYQIQQISPKWIIKYICIIDSNKDFYLILCKYLDRVWVYWMRSWQPWKGRLITWKPELPKVENLHADCW